MEPGATSPHCTDCQTALDADRMGWCVACKTFVAASACTWGPGTYRVELQDLTCPGCGKRWCFGLDDVFPSRWG